MPTLNPYLNFNGNTEEAFNFYKSVFGGEFASLRRYSDMEGDKLSPKDQQKILHVALPIGSANILMGSDVVEAYGKPVQQGNNLLICIHPDSKQDADRLFQGLSAGGKVETPMQDMFWGAYYGSFTDKFGVNWMINFDQNKK